MPSVIAAPVSFPASYFKIPRHSVIVEVGMMFVMCYAWMDRSLFGNRFIFNIYTSSRLQVIQKTAPASQQLPGSLVIFAVPQIDCIVQKCFLAAYSKFSYSNNYHKLRYAAYLTDF